MSDSCIIVGASHAGVSLALQLRREGWTAPIKLIGEESELPYHRPPLSKEHLAGKKDLDAMRLRPAKLYADNDIDLLLSTRVNSIDTAAREVQLQSGESLGYQKLALCTGASVREFNPARGLENVFYIRTAADIARLAPHVRKGRRALVIGGGYIGLEAAAVLAQQEVSVSVLEMAERILQRVTSPAMSDYMQRLHESHGVEVHSGVEVESIREEGQEKLICCADGTEFRADFLIVGIGVEANASLALNAGIETGAGIQVNEYCRTSDEHVYAAGDCTVHPSLIYQRSISLESVQNANDQARAAAANICGKEQVYNAVPWFWSDQYSIKLQMAGLNTDYDQVVMRGSAEGGIEASFALFYLKEGVLIAADCVARPKEFMVSKKLIKEGTKIAAEHLQNEEIEPISFVTA
ncbi:MAG: pyridine nucleotide-disulfide oxidoreductase [SAR86 cluster bacterium]|uniref:Pyridine nucleotide-disulfide oxidoreductase n=1 Tax=SAR86 cluster bacterium TaxID=2030880 RepID=A0A2A4WUJ5_9GAMM|nr:MAG: pyridine nucleotide-disulfide oxidoreductase [SAR86 cluster bacterium]